MYTNQDVTPFIFKSACCQCSNRS